jgi:GPI mannosyltransferase 2
MIQPRSPTTWMSSSRDEVVLKHLQNVRIASFVAWLLTIALLYLSASLPLFDSSPNVTLVEKTTRNRLVHPLLRWDAFHFVHIARHGYVYEHQWAFLSGIAAIMSYPARLLRILQLAESSTGLFSFSDLLASGALLSTVCGSSTTLYHLTLHHFGSPSIAYLTALLSLLPSSPATIYFSVYNEPFFTYLSYRGTYSHQHFLEY